jgi:Domain of unknown function (DUF4440)
MAPDDARIEDDGKQIRLLLGRITDAWLKGRPDDLDRALEGCFHREAVITGPSCQELGKGEQACIKSYADFVRQAEIRECRLSEPVIDLYGNTAVAACEWEMTYALDGHEYKEAGHDLFVLTKARGRWQAAWRMLLPDEKR